jgi:hypothetical protein
MPENQNCKNLLPFIRYTPKKGNEVNATNLI